MRGFSHKSERGPALNSIEGFTLLELLVVVAVIAVSTIFIVPNLGKSTDDQRLKNVAEELQALIRQAQNNAQSGVLCSGIKGNYWGVQFKRISATAGLGITYDLICGVDRSHPTAIGSHGLPSGFIIEDTAGAITCSAATSSSLTPLPNTTTNVFVVFGNVAGAVSFGCTDSTGTNNNCSGTPAASCGYISLNTAPNHLLYSNAKNITVTIKSQKTLSTKSVVIEKGGAIYVQ